MRQLLLGIIVGLLAGALIAAGFVIVSEDAKSSASAVGYNEIASNGNVQGRLYTGDPTAESGLVEAEEDRLDYVRTVTSAAQWQFAAASQPYRVQTGERATLVLTPREAPYTLDDLELMLPDGLSTLENGALLLSESIVVLEGSTFAIGREDAAPLTLLLDSTADSFVSILSLGGTIDVSGTATADVAVSSWDSQIGAPDAVTDDGRAYVRMIGGTASLEFARFSDLGFWSGNTGGVSISGGSAPIASIGGDRAEEVVAPGAAPLLPSVEVDAFAVDRAEGMREVSASVTDVSFERNAFGLFVTDAADVTITGSTIRDSLIDGLVLHRFVTGAVISDTTSTGNAVDGIAVSRSSERLTFETVTASGNGRNGLSIDGSPLADGPSASGSTVHSYGDSRVVNGTFSDNGRYGIEMSGGHDVRILDNTLSANTTGVVTSGLADRITIAGNEFSDQLRQSVAIRDGSSGVDVSDNVIRGGDTGVFVRNADAVIEGNSLEQLAKHGVTMLGASPETRVHHNAIAGSGTSPIYQDEASSSAAIGANSTKNWRPAITPATVAKSFFQPLTIIWLGLALLLVITALARGRRRAHVITDPYASMAPLSSFTRGVVSPLGERRGG